MVLAFSLLLNLGATGCQSLHIYEMENKVDTNALHIDNSQGLPSTSNNQNSVNFYV